MCIKEAIKKLQETEDKIESIRKRLDTISKCEKGTFYSSNNTVLKFRGADKYGQELEISLQYQNSNEWVKFHLQQEKNLAIGRLHEAKITREKIAKYLNEQTKLLNSITEAA